MRSKYIFINEKLDEMYPDAHCELNYKSAFQLLCAVCLSAQTTDASVNKVTPNLFELFPKVEIMAQAKIEDIESIIKSIGLYHNKARNLLKMSNKLITDFNGKVPDKLEDLIKLDGVGRKTANVVLGEYFKQPSFAVDTHVLRVSKRLGLTNKSDNPLKCEYNLKKKFDKEIWSKLHHQIIFFGRYHCTARKPKCYDCVFIDICKEKNKNLQNKTS